ncbi:MAG: hypothetical protein SH850_11865 [Planctomycetaceae bacterium]|nr:hypothetical protein [Planctomycetaceae bacterium]
MVMTIEDRAAWLVTVRRTIAEAERAITGAEQMMRDRVAPIDIERTRVGLWRLRAAERYLDRAAVEDEPEDG